MAVRSVATVCQIVPRLLIVSGVVFVAAVGDVRGQSAGGAPQPVVIERAPVAIRDPATYDVPLKLRAAKQITLVSHVDGVVQLLRAKPGEKVPSQTEVCRLDSRRRQLELERAQAAQRAAEDDLGKGGSGARVEVAKKDLELAQLGLEQTITRVPFECHLFQIHAVEGEFVRAGDPLVTIADQSRLVVEVPVDRRVQKVGDTIELKVEDATVNGKLTAILPLSERFDPLRGLFQSVASGLVELDNGAGQYLAGQTVYSPLIPRQPVTEVPGGAIANTDDGGRKVQVIRDGVVRDVPVQLLGQVGENHLWVSGRFGKDDQVILHSSEPLLDGSQVALQGQPLSATPGANAPAAPTAPGGNPPPRYYPTFD
jgi:hypothetical protein